MTETDPTVTNIKRHAGIAGQFSITATVTYPGEAPEETRFVGSTYGGPVLAVWKDQQVFVKNPDRFGAFGIEWVRRFYA